jgi:hypothetical protein
MLRHRMEQRALAQAEHRVPAQGILQKKPLIVGMASGAETEEGMHGHLLDPSRTSAER